MNERESSKKSGDFFEKNIFLKNLLDVEQRKGNFSSPRASFHLSILKAEGKGTIRIIDIGKSYSTRIRGKVIKDYRVSFCGLPIK